MRFVKAAAFVLVAALLGVAGLAAYRADWLHSPSPQNAELPVVEFREEQCDLAGKTGTLLTIDRSGEATLQTLPLGPGSKTKRIRLTCDELAWLPQAMKDELAVLRPSYGSDIVDHPRKISVIYRWDRPERRVEWLNPQSSPKPREGNWAGLVAPLEDIRRRAQEPQETSWPLEGAIIAYNKISEGIVGTYSNLLTIDKSGHAIERNFRPYGLGAISETQLAPEELAALLRAFEEAKFADFQPCYGKHTPTNRQNAYLFYEGNSIRKAVTWMNAGSDPKPPEGWFRIVEILDQIREHARETKTKPASSPHR